LIGENSAVESPLVNFRRADQWLAGREVIAQYRDHVEKALKANGYCVAVVPHIVQQSGTLMPVNALHDTLFALDGAEEGLMLLIDGAHSLGQVPVHAKSYRNAIFLWSGHKWAYGPHGTGGLVFGEGVRDPLIQAIAGSSGMREPFVFSPEWTRRSMPSLSTRQWVGIDTSRFIGLDASMDLHRILWREQSDGPDEWEVKADRTLHLRTQMVRMLESELQRFGSPFRVLFPTDARVLAEVTTHSVAPGIVLLDSGYDGETRLKFHDRVVMFLADRHIIVNTLENSGYIRLCLTPFLTSDQVEVACRSIAQSHYPNR
jgi:selenocysteine lyase/cysteine desulfurase